LPAQDALTEQFSDRSARPLRFGLHRVDARDRASTTFRIGRILQNVNAV
jgi:hypothetical protein